MDLHGRSFLAELDFTPGEWTGLVELAASLKAEWRSERSGGRAATKHLVGRQIALVFEKTSTRTRCAFEVAAHHQGAATTYLDPAGSQLGHKESVADTARVLGRMYDGIAYRGFGQDRVEELAARAGVPVWNGLTDEWHPTQMLADQLTMREHLPPGASSLKDVTWAYVGDARCNVGNSVLVSGALAGMDVRVVAPAALHPTRKVVDAAEAIANTTGAHLTVTSDIDAVAGADFVYTDIWVSMGEPRELWSERVDLLRPYQVNQALLMRTGNPVVQVMHDLPALHDLGTELARQLHAETGLTAFEITDDVFEAHADIIFDEAENRMHTIKAVLVATLGR